MPIQHWSDRIWVVRLLNEPTFSEDLTALKDQVIVLGSPPDIVIDLSNVEHLNSSNLAQLLKVRKMAIDRDMRLRLAAPVDGVWAVFLTTGLDKVFEFAQDVTSALAGLQMDQNRN